MHFRLEEDDPCLVEMIRLHVLQPLMMIENATNRFANQDFDLIIDPLLSNITEGVFVVSYDLLNSSLMFINTSSHGNRNQLYKLPFCSNIKSYSARPTVIGCLMP